MADTHSVMPKKLAQALMEAGVQHFDFGGMVNTLGDVGLGGFGQVGQQLTGMKNSDLTGGAGINNQFQQGNPAIQQQEFGPQIAAQQQRQTDIYNQQQNLAQALLAQSQGQGPNPAQAALAQHTGANAAQQGALMASQRGASANPALIARQAAMQGMQAQQAGVGQAATLQAQQQLAAQQALQQQQAQMGNQALQGESIQQGGQAALNSALTTGQLGAGNINANVAAGNQSTKNGILGGLMGGAGAVLGGLFHDGGQVKRMAVGGMINDNLGIQNYAAPSSIEPIPMSNIDQGKDIKGGMTGLGQGLMQSGLLGGGAAGAGGYSGALMAGGAGDAIAGLAPLALVANQGAVVPGEPEVDGNDEKNDKVPALLSPGEVVLPRSVTMSPDAAKKAAEFMMHLKGKKKNYSDVTEARKKKMACGGKVY